MKLKEFVEKFVQHNSMIRLVYKHKGGHEIVLDNWDQVCMDHQLIKRQGIFAAFADHEVIGVCDILVTDGNYTEAVNICIERQELNWEITEDAKKAIKEGGWDANSDETYKNHEGKDVRTSKDWYERDKSGVVIMDPDGWDRANYEWSFNMELITEEEYENRKMQSTCIFGDKEEPKK